MSECRSQGSTVGNERGGKCSAGVCKRAALQAAWIPTISEFGPRVTLLHHPLKFSDFDGVRTESNPVIEGMELTRAITRPRFEEWLLDVRLRRVYG
jgi:hypothetical protein